MRISSFAAAAVAVFLIACGSHGNLTSPSPVSNPTPDQSQYEQLGTMHRLVDSQGKQTDMWVKVEQITPDRGSMISFDPPTQGCSTCFHYQGTMGMDAGEPANHSTSAAAYFSQDGVNPQGENIGGASAIQPGADGLLGNMFIGYQFPSPAPKWLLVVGSHYYQINGVNQADRKIGYARVQLDYKP